MSEHLEDNKDYENVCGSWFYNKKDKVFSWDSGQFFNLYVDDFHYLLDYLIEQKIVKVGLYRPKKGE